MKWSEIIRSERIVIGGVEYDLRHLHDAVYDITIPGSGNHQDIKTKLFVRYSSHCISVGPEDDVPIDFDIVGIEKRILDHRLVPRAFSEERYELSKMLPGIFSKIVDRKCFYSSDRNFFIIEFIDKEGGKASYCVYFNVKKEVEGLDVYVESAYVPRVIVRPNDGSRSIQARVILAKRFRGEQIKRIPLR
ncbi:hypothetical protein [Fundidesulfovibrio putealis]|uniref:hypothetical protein n=1 Tax=Fundidesulfovibrio putealis TaxID=270496 RepID=UPI0012EC5697|nr:hypothetical protein [Fundidesulfovibrio putealis]